MHWLYYAVLLIILLSGLILNLFTLPGNWLMLAGVGIYALVTRGEYVSWVWLIILFVLALLAELIELSAAGAGAKKQGGSRWGSIGGLAGGIAGGIALTGLIPIIPPLNTLAGILLGTFVGAMGGELVGGKKLGHSALIGLGALKGRAVGTFMKFAFGCAIAILSLIVAFPWPRHRPVTSVGPAPTTLQAH